MKQYTVKVNDTEIYNGIDDISYYQMCASVHTMAHITHYEIKTIKTFQICGNGEIVRTTTDYHIEPINH